MFIIIIIIIIIQFNPFQLLFFLYINTHNQHGIHTQAKTRNKIN